MVENTNPNGLGVKVGGKTIATNATEKFFIPGNGGSVYTTLTFDRNPSFYDYEGVQIGMYPSCDAYIVDSKTLNIHFHHDCSDISIIRPSDGWVINSDTGNIGIYLGDYNPFNPELKRMQLMYRRIGPTRHPDYLGYHSQYHCRLVAELLQPV